MTCALYCVWMWVRAYFLFIFLRARQRVLIEYKSRKWTSDSSTARLPLFAALQLKPTAARAGLNLERAQEGERNTVSVLYAEVRLCLAAGQTRAAAPEQTADKAAGSHVLRLPASSAPVTASSFRPSPHSSGLRPVKLWHEQSTPRCVLNLGHV